MTTLTPTLENDAGRTSAKATESQTLLGRKLRYRKKL